MMKTFATILCIFAALWCSPLRAQSGSGGSGASMACNGGEPDYCARSDRAIQQITMLAPPAVEVPFVDPDLGMRQVRVTGPLTIPSDPYDWYGANSSDTVNQWGLYDSSLCAGQGGYRFIIQTHAAGQAPFELCNKTMQVIQISTTPLSFSNTGAQFSRTDPAAVFGFNGTTAMDLYCYPDAGTNPTIYPWCAGKAGTYTTEYDYSSCPNLPSIIPTTWSKQPSQDAGDRYFTTAFAADQQLTGFIMQWDKQTGNCKWFMPATWSYGGTGQSQTTMSGGTFSGSIPAPTCTAITGTGTLTAGTYTCGVVFSSDGLETGAWISSISGTTPVTITSGQVIRVIPPSCSDNWWCTALGEGSYQPNYGVMLCAGTGCTPKYQEYLQVATGDGSTKVFSGTASNNNLGTLASSSGMIVGSGAWNYYSSAPWGICNPCSSNSYYGFSATSGAGLTNPAYAVTFASAPASGVPVWFMWTQNASSTTTITDLVTAGPSSPAIGGGGVGIHDAESNMAGNEIFWEPDNSTLGMLNAIFWNPVTESMSGCNNLAGCSGHPVYGWTHYVGVENNANFLNYSYFGPQNYAIQTFAAPMSPTALLSGPPAGAAGGNSGTQHVGWNNDAFSPMDALPACHGTASAGAYLPPLSATDEQLYCFGTSPAGSNTIWRFAFTKATGAFYEGGVFGQTGWGDSTFWHLSFGTQSQDGKYALYSTDWYGSLGLNGGLGNWAPLTSYSQGSEARDSNNNLEVETAASCTSGSGAPGWLAALNAKISGDGNCSWVLLYVNGQPWANLTWTASGAGGGGYSKGAAVLDPSHHVQVEIAPFCGSGPSTPTWNDSGGITTEGSCEWQDDGSSGLTVTPGNIETRMDAFIVELK